jgi:tetratricopeptide (TPR) repeat protein
VTTFLGRKKQMGFRLQRSIRLGKFVRLNISKSGVGVSMGVPGLRISTGPRGANFSAGIPGTGLSYRQKLGGGKRAKSKKVDDTPRPQAVQPNRPAADTPRPQPVSPRPAALPEQPEPSFFAPHHEKELFKGLTAYHAGQFDQALAHFEEAAPHEAGAAILAASILARQEGQEFKASELLENVAQSDAEFPTELMQKYLVGATLEIGITPNVTAYVPLDGLAATLLLVELYQRERRVREAIALLEEVEELAGEPVLTLSLCELYASRELWDNIIERAKRTEPTDDVTLETLLFYGRAMMEKGLDEAAIAVFTKGLRQKKDINPALYNEARYWRAVLYQEQGKTQQAGAEFQKLYADDPDFGDVAERLAELAIR